MATRVPGWIEDWQKPRKQARPRPSNRSAFDIFGYEFCTRFGLEPTAVDSQLLVTPKHAADLAIAQVSIVDHCDRAQTAWDLASRHLADVLGRESIGRDDRLEDLMPLWGRKRKWRKLGLADEGFTVDLRRPLALFWILVALSIAASVAVPMLLPAPWWTGLFILPLAGWVLAFVTKPFKTLFPWGFETASDMADAAQYAGLSLAGERVPWTENQVMAVTVRIAQDAWEDESITAQTVLLRDD